MTTSSLFRSSEVRRLRPPYTSPPCVCLEGGRDVDDCEPTQGRLKYLGLYDAQLRADGYYFLLEGTDRQEGHLRMRVHPRAYSTLTLPFAVKEVPEDFKFYTLGGDTDGSGSSPDTDGSGTIWIE